MKIWDKYKKSNQYITDNRLIDMANWFYDMYLGNQWKGIKVSTKLPVMNFTKQVVDYKTAAIGQNEMTATFSDSQGNTMNDAVYKTLNAFWNTRWQKEDMNAKMYQMVLESGILGDAYIYFGKKDDSRLIPQTSILLADEQNPDLQSQEYVMIRIRPFIKEVKAIAKKNGVPDSDIGSIRGEKEPDYIVGNKNDINYSADDDKCTAVIYFEKIDGVVNVARATENCEYEPLHPLAVTDPMSKAVIFGSKYYPIAKLTCCNSPNNARGRGWVEDLIPNQIELNKTYAKSSQAMANTAYPRIAYNSDKILNPEDLEVTGAPIEVEGNAQSVSQLISYLQGVPMSGDVFTYIENLFTTTKQVAGASDAITGISDPTRVSGSAISEIREQSTLTLKGNVIRLKQTYKDIARIRMDTWQLYYPKGIEVQREPTSQEKEQIKNGEFVDLTETINGETLRALEPDVSIDVSLMTQATKDGTQAILDDKLEKGMITFSEWVEASDGDGNVPKAKLQKIIDERKSNGLDPNTGLAPQQLQTPQSPQQ